MLPLQILPHLDAHTACEKAGPQMVGDFVFPFAGYSTTSPLSVPLSGALKARMALLLFLSDPIPRECLDLCLLSAREWNRALHWLDTSGLALYFFARLQEKNRESQLPEWVLRRLRQNLADNKRRTASLLAESAAIQREFQRSGLRYAVLKGFSLLPHSVPRLELRSQLDLDYLIAERDAPAARCLLEKRGYRLRAISGRSWEFKIDAPPSSLAELYSDSSNWSVELHLEAPNTPSALLPRLEHIQFHDMSVPVLAPADLFIGQGLHLYKHICSEFYRTAHLLEFRRHVLSRYDDSCFWEQVRERGERNLRTVLALGVATLLIEKTMGPFAPESLTGWTAERLPRTLRAWVDRYGMRSAVMSFPGSKHYLLLQREIESLGIGSRRTVGQALVPRALPPAVAVATPDESLAARIRRCFFQYRFILYRLRFHIFAGFDYLREARAWRAIVSAEVNSQGAAKL